MYQKDTGADAEHGNIYTVIVKSVNSLALYRNQWDELLSKSPQKSPTLSYAWLATFFEHCLRPNESWMCILAYEHNTLLGLLPVIVRPHPILRRHFPMLSTPNDLQTNSVDFLVAQGREYEAITILLRALTEALPRWLHLKLVRIPEDSPTLQLTHKSLSGFYVLHDLNGWGFYVRISGAFEDYFNALSSNFRRTLKKAKRRTQRLSNAETVFLEHLSGKTEEAEHFFKLEASGWKGRLGSAINNDQTLSRFYKTLTRRLAQSSWLELHFLRAEGKLIAGHMAIRLNQVLTIPKIAYNESYSRYSPGNLLFLNMLEREFAVRRLIEVDCLTDMAWHRLWNMQRRAYYDVVILPDTFVPKILGLYPAKIGGWLRQIKVIRNTVRLTKRLLRGLRRG